MPQKTIEAIDKTKSSYGKQTIILLFSAHSFKEKRSVILEENEYNHEGIRIERYVARKIAKSKTIETIKKVKPVKKAINVVKKKISSAWKGFKKKVKFWR